MKKFDINSAKMGNPVCTGMGEDVTIFKFDMRAEQPIVGMIDLKNGLQEIHTWSANGIYFFGGSYNDLMMK